MKTQKKRQTPDVFWRFAACPVCFQMDGSTVVDGVRLAVAVLVGVTILVLAGFVRFALRVARAQRSDR